MRILILCTGNSCRSQMAEAFLKASDRSLEVYSAGTQPADSISSRAMIVMREIGIDMERQYPKNVSRFLGRDFDYVITVCDNANKICPMFTGKTKYRLHFGFEDPVHAHGTDDDKMRVFRRVRDQIRERFSAFLLERGM